MTRHYLFKTMATRLEAIWHVLTARTFILFTKSSAGTRFTGIDDHYADLYPRCKEFQTWYHGQAHHKIAPAP